VGHLTDLDFQSFKVSDKNQKSGALAPDHTVNLNWLNVPRLKANEFDRSHLLSAWWRAEKLTDRRLNFSEGALSSANSFRDA